MNYEEANRRAWDQMVRSGSQFARVATDEECAQPLVTLDCRGWLPGSVKGLEVLCLAAGGGWKSILYASAGARVTVVDLSAEMLKLDPETQNIPVVTCTVAENDEDTQDDGFDLREDDVFNQPPALQLN